MHSEHGTTPASPHQVALAPSTATTRVCVCVSTKLKALLDAIGACCDIQFQRLAPRFSTHEPYRSSSSVLRMECAATSRALEDRSGRVVGVASSRVQSRCVVRH
jgi:hypothetical protein